MEPPLKAGSISHGHVHIPSLPMATGLMRTSSLRTRDLGYELPQNNQNKGVVHRITLLSATSLTNSCSLCLSHLHGYEKDLTGLSDLFFYQLRS